MALPDVVAAVVDLLGAVEVNAAPVADQVLDEPPAKLPDDRTFIVYCDPGEATLESGRGGSGRVVYEADDVVRVDWHRRAARDAMAETYPEALAVYLATRDAIFSGVKNGALDGTITGFGGVQTTSFGPLEYWNADTSFGFQIALLCRHMTEAAA